MKKLLLIIAALFISFNTFAQEIETTVDGIKYFLENNEAYVVGNEEYCDPVTLTIPEAIEYGNTTYTVVQIDANAFVCSNLTTVVIPSGVREIGNKAFYEAPNLVKVECLSTTPPTMSQSTSTRYRVFYNYSDLKIYIPEGCVNTYKSTWYTYENNIQGEDPIVFKGGSGSSDWNVTGNWSGLPNGEISALADKDVIIRAAAVIPSNYEAEVKSFTIDEENGGSITIREGGQLIVHATSTGNVTMEKTINSYSTNDNNIITRGWYSISTPFTKITLHNLNPDNAKHEFFYYDEPSNFWKNYKATEFDITLGKGYIYAQEYEDNYTISITGTPNTDNKEIDLTAQSEDVNLKGFNLIGNPFMHNIKIGNIEDDYNIISGAYYKLSNAGAFNVKYNDGDEIKPLEGILVQATESGSIKICNEHKSSSKRSDKGSICVNVSNKEYSDVAYISFNEGIGLNKIEHRNNEIPMVYVPVDGTNYALAIMDEDVEEIPVNFEAKKMGEYTISVSAEGRKYNRLTLLDKENNKEINMLAGSYTFLATVNDNPARFILKASLNNNQEAAFYTENNSIIIDNMKGAATVHVYDVMGRPVMKYNTNDSNCQLSTSSLANGVYIIQLMDENGTQVQKVIVNN